MKKKPKFPLTFKNEESFVKYLSSRKEYVLDALTQNKHLSEDKYICDSNILIYALRYALGRKTGAVNRIVDWVLDEWNRIDSDERNMIVKEIVEFEKNYGNLGYDWHRELWYQIVNKHLIGLIDEIN